MTAIEYRIMSNEEKDDDGTNLYWSNQDGWVDRASATVFTIVERDKVNLPLGDCRWVWS